MFILFCMTNQVLSLDQTVGTKHKTMQRESNNYEETVHVIKLNLNKYQVKLQTNIKLF